MISDKNFVIFLALFISLMVYFYLQHEESSTSLNKNRLEIGGVITKTSIGYKGVMGAESEFKYKSFIYKVKDDVTWYKKLYQYNLRCGDSIRIVFDSVNPNNNKIIPYNIEKYKEKRRNRLNERFLRDVKSNVNKETSTHANSFE